MIRALLLRTPARFRVAPALSLLSVVAIALGVGAVLAVDLLNRAAIQTLDASLEAVSGTTDLVVRSVREPPARLPDEAWPLALGVPGLRRVSPVVRIPGASVDGAPLTVLGVDALSGSFGSLAGGVAEEAEFRAGGSTLRLPLLGTDGGAAFVDLADAQELRGEPGIDRLEVELPAGADPDELARRIEAAVPGSEAATGGTLRRQGADLFAAFRMNLRALAAVSLLVAAFLIYASARAGLQARRRELGLYRALGAPATGVGGLLIGEAAVTAALGALIGIPLAALGAFAALDGVSRTLTNFYLLERVESVALRPEGVLVAFAAGLAAALVGALPEIWIEARRPPARLLLPGRETASGRRRSWSGFAGLALALFAVHAAVDPDGFAARPGGGFVAAGALLAGAAMLTGAALRLGGRISADRRNPLVRGMAAALREPSSSAPPAAALVVAVAMLTGVTALVASFRDTLDAWLLQTLTADLYVSASGDARGARRELPPEALAAVEGEDFRAVDVLRALRVRVRGTPVNVFGVTAALSGDRFAIVGDREAALRGFREGGILVSEPLALREGLGPGDRFALPGEEALEVAGVHREYGNEFGALFMDRKRLAELYPDGAEAAHGVALYLRDGADSREAAVRLERRFEGRAVVVENGALRTRALEVFDQTMSVTGLLRAIALFIAAVGLGLSLFAVARERAPQIALERALGATRRQVALAMVGRGVLISLVGLALGGGAGALLTLLLVEVVNPAWFGWRLSLHWPVGLLVLQAALVLGTGLLAAAIPGRAAARTGAVALRSEL